MTRTLRIVAIGLVGLILATGRAAAQLPPQPLEVAGAAAHVYKTVGDVQLRLHVVRAEGCGRSTAGDRPGGGSSGRHLALTTAMIDGFDDPADDRSVPTKPVALVLFNPAMDTARITDRFGERAREASPLHHVTAGLPPMIIMHGKDDTTVPYSEAETFCTSVTAAGGSCRLVGYDGATHGFFNRQVAGGRWYGATLSEADRFLTGLGYLR